MTIRPRGEPPRYAAFAAQNKSWWFKSPPWGRWHAVLPKAAGRRRELRASPSPHRRPQLPPKMAMAMACAPEEVRDMPPSEPRARARRPSLSSLAPPLLLSHHEQEEERGEGRDAYKCPANARATLCGGRESQLSSGSPNCGCGCKCDRWVAYGARADCEPKPGRIRGEGIKREAGREDGGRLDKERVVRVGEALCACVGDGLSRSRPGRGAARLPWKMRRNQRGG